MIQEEQCKVLSKKKNNNIKEQIKEAFSNSEQTSIKSVSLESYPGGSNGAPNSDYISEDKVFILSYFDSVNTTYGFNKDYNYYDQSRIGIATDYAINHFPKGNVDSLDKSYRWWIRDIGEETNQVKNVSIDGTISDIGALVSNPYGVRPAMYISLSSVYSTGKVNISVKGTEYDTVKFGNFEGKELIWRVLGVNGKDAFLLSDKCIINKAYNDERNNITWKDCSL